MRINTFSISKRESTDDFLHIWQIDMHLLPTWFERVVLRRKPSSKTLIGSCSHWCWTNDYEHHVPANYLWRMWAYRQLNIFKERTK
jgi:hypothetical protein